MQPNWSRRRTCHVCGSMIGLTALGGCLSRFVSPPDAGSLVIRNDAAVDHTVTITAMRVSRDDDNFEEFNRTPDPNHTPLWVRDEEFTVTGGAEMTRADFLTESGKYYIKVLLDNGEQGNEWIELWETNGELAANNIHVSINEGGSVDVFSTHQD